MKLISLFAKYAKEDADGYTHLDQGKTVQALAESLGLPLKRVKIITVNGKQGDLTTPLKDEDLVYIFPPAIGGG